MIKIAILGPESTGKTSIVNFLKKNKHYHFVKEIARDYLQEIKLKYNYQDIINIAKLQLTTQNQEYEIAKNNGVKIFICDTELITIQIWLEYLGYNSPKWIEESIKSDFFDYFFLTNTDIDWISDELRENESNRDEIYKIFEDKLLFYNKKIRYLSGTNEQRFTNVEQIIKEIIENNKK